MIPYKTQFDKIVGAYLRNELNPGSSCACFIGNLLNRKQEWSGARNLYTGKIEFGWNEDSAFSCILEESQGMYTPEEVYALEHLFMTEVGMLKGDIYVCSGDIYNYEERLFKAMEVTLEALKQLHIEKGEIIPEYPVFNKRVLEDSVKV